MIIITGHIASRKLHERMSEKVRECLNFIMKTVLPCGLWKGFQACPWISRPHFENFCPNSSQQVKIQFLKRCCDSEFKGP